MSTSFSAAQIAAIQAEARATAYDQDEPKEHLACLQELYAATKMQRRTVRSIFEEEGCIVKLEGQFKQETMHWGNAVADLRPVIFDLFDRRLIDLEGQMIQAHLDIERDEQERAMGHEQPREYTAAIQALCTPTPVQSEAPVPTPTPVTPPAPVSVTNVRPSRTATTAPGTGLRTPGSAANAVAA